MQDLFTRAQWGKSYGATKGAWYKVPFEVTFTEEPAVIIIGVARTGGLMTRLIDKVAASAIAPLSSIPVAVVDAPEKIAAVVVAAPEKISAGKIAKFEIPRIGIGTAAEVGKQVGDAYMAECKNRLGDWGWLNFIKDGICSVTWGIGYITGTWVHWMYTILVQPQIDKVRDAVNTAISDQTDKINSALSSQVDKINVRLGDLTGNVNSALSSQVDKINTRIQDLRNKVNAALSMDKINAAFESLRISINSANSSQIDKVIARVNAVLFDLYDSWGLPSGIIATPVHVNNVSTSGFSWQSYGATTIYWIAMGKTRLKFPELPFR